MKHKLFLTLICLLASASLLVGCASPATATPAPTQVSPSGQGTSATVQPTVQPTSEPVTIKYVGFAGSVGGYKVRADAFMKTHPNIKVVVEGIPGNSWAEVMQAIAINIAGGDIPDIADIATEGMQSFATNNIIIPLDPYIQRDQAELKPTLDDMDPNLLKSGVVNGKTYGLPTVWNTMVFYVNKNVLATAGVDMPKEGWTLNDFLNICQKVVSKNTGGAKDTWCFDFANGYFLTFVPWLLVNNSNVLTDDWSKSRLAEPNSIQTMQLLYDFVYKYKIAPKLDIGVGDFDLFVQNRLAFMAAGTWQINGLANAKFNPADYDVVNFPTITSNKKVMGVGFSPIFTASQHKDAAWEFAKYLSSKDFQDNVVVADGWSTPALKSAFDLFAQRPDFPKNGAILYSAAKDGVTVPAPPEYGLIEETMTREFGAAMANSLSMADAMKEADKEINAAFAKRPTPTP